MTGYVATRWYRAPEIMLNWMHYNQTGDVSPHRAVRASGGAGAGRHRQGLGRGGAGASSQAPLAPGPGDGVGMGPTAKTPGEVCVQS